METRQTKKKSLGNRMIERNKSRKSKSRTKSRTRTKSRSRTRSRSRTKSPMRTITEEGPMQISMPSPMPMPTPTQGPMPMPTQGPMRMPSLMPIVPRKGPVQMKTRSKRRAASTTIVKFMRQSQHSRKARYLESLCSDSGVCLAFGRLADEIKKHFGGFTSFDYVVPPIKRIGAPSENGFINLIEYQHRRYTACAILKSSKTVDADNLLYEFIVGQYINKLNKQYPCFLETYGYYMYSDNSMLWTELQSDTPITDVTVLKNGLRRQKYIDYNDACRESSKLAILIQYFKDIQSLQKLSVDPVFIENDLMHALFQLYHPLAALKNNFTHYDLHLENVYLYKPVADKYIHYHYYLSRTRAISFKSSYMVKIIDYGRSYFNDPSVPINSKKIYDEELCGAASDCNDPDTTGDCGYKVGFGWFKKLSANPGKQYYISTQKKNISHDLLPLTRIKENHAAPRTNRLTPELTEVLGKVVWDKTNYYGTAEVTDTGYPYAIYNVQDAAKCLLDYVTSKKYMDKNEQAYAGLTKLGDLYIYGDGRPMRFV